MLVSKAITTVGSGNDADLRLLTVPSQWVVIHREPESLSIRVLASGQRLGLAPGASVALDGLTLSCEWRVPAETTSSALEELSAALAGAESAETALPLLLQGAMAACDAETGAIIVSDGGTYRIATARDATGAIEVDAAALLSDTIVRDVLGTGQRLCLTNLSAHQRYAQIPSVVSLHLRSVLCLPLRLEERTLGALYLGKRATGAGFGERLIADLRILTTLAVPFLAQLRRARGAAAADTLLGESPAMTDVRRLIERVAPSDLSVLVVGGSGTGKELVVRAIHEASPRRARPLVALNCAAVPESLLGAELFGYRKGAFTGALADREGLVEAAAGSTLFLDEVGDMPLAMQAALLRVLEQREVRRLGETHARSVDFRLIAATHRDLSAEVAAGRFREDLRFRLAELTVELPSLADRGQDLDLLARFFLRQAESQLSLPMHTLGSDAEALLRAHSWPGNVRELRATMRRAAVLADDRIIRAADLRLDRPVAAAPGGAAEASLGDLSRPLAEARDDFVNRYAAAVLARCGGDREATARSLAIGLRTLYRYLST